MESAMQVSQGSLAGPRGLAVRTASKKNPIYSICTMVTDWKQYADFLSTFRSAGFTDFDCELLTIDNSKSNNTDAYIALNEFLQAALGEYVIVVHQDVRLLDDNRQKLDDLLSQLSKHDPSWAVCGNAGFNSSGLPVICISHPTNKKDIIGEPFPQQVVSLDENFLLVKRVANLALSRDLSGFHHYGGDLCIVADVLGWNCYVIDFFLRHNSAGTFDDVYARSKQALVSKYLRAFQPRWIYLVTHHHVFIGGFRQQDRMEEVILRLKKLIGLSPRFRDYRNLRQRTKFERKSGGRN